MSRHVFESQERLVREQFPQLGDGWCVQMCGWALSELTGSAHEIHDRQQALMEGGEFESEALAKALEEAVVKVEAPKGHQFVRLVKDGEPATLVLLRMP